MSEDQIPGYQSNPNDTLHKGGTDAPNVPLDEIQKQLLEYLGTLKYVQEAEEEIEKKYSIKKDDIGLWSVDDIKKAWSKTQEMDCSHKNERAHWSVVIILLMLLQRKKESEYDATKTLSDFFSGLNVDDSPEKTQDYSEPSAVNISEETKPSKVGKRSEEDLENSEKDDPGKNASEKLPSQNSDSGSQGIYIPLTELKATNPQPDMEKQEENTRVKEDKSLVLIDEVPTFHNQDNDRYTLLKKTSHVVQYDNKTNNAAWVFEILNKETINGPATVQSEYRLDYSTQKENRAPESLKKYTDTGYERGHLAAAANHKWCQKARDDTNLLSNIAPQHRDLNQGKWRKLENHCRKYVEGEYSKAYIYTGPLYRSTTDHNFREEFEKELPTHFFKVIILEKENGERKLECYEIPNEAQGENQLNYYRTNINAIEEASGLRFTENNPVNLRGREEKVTVNFKADEEEVTIITNVEIIPRQNTFPGEE